MDKTIQEKIIKINNLDLLIEEKNKKIQELYTENNKNSASKSEINKEKNNVIIIQIIVIYIVIYVMIFFHVDYVIMKQ